MNPIPLVILKFVLLAILLLLAWRIGAVVATRVTIGSARKGRVRGITVVRSVSQRGFDTDIRRMMVLGRGPDADFVIEDPYASGSHLRVRPAESSLLLTDLDSPGGTFVNGKRASGPTMLDPGDIIQVGKTVLEVR